MVRALRREIAAHSASVSRWEFVFGETGGFPHVDEIVELAKKLAKPLSATASTKRNTKPVRATNTRRDNAFASQLAEADDRLYCVCEEIDGGRDMSQCTQSDCLINEGWWHNDCVLQHGGALPDAAADVWLCPTCSPPSPLVSQSGRQVKRRKRN